eukprot:362201-Chlamydomonas_euryale.AAC.3
MVCARALRRDGLGRGQDDSDGAASTGSSTACRALHRHNKSGLPPHTLRLVSAQGAGWSPLWPLAESRLCPSHACAPWHSGQPAAENCAAVADGVARADRDKCGRLPETGC